MNKNQSGFNVVEIVMAIVIVGLIGAVGYLFWDKIVNKPTDSKTAAASTQSPSPTPTPTVSTKTYTSGGLGVAFDYPSTWTLSPNPASHTQKYYSAPGSESKLVKAPSGLTMFFNTLATDGLGGTGPCDDTITDFTDEGTAQLDKAYVQSFTDNGVFILRVSSSQSKDYIHAVGCPTLSYDSMVNVREASVAADGSTLTEPYEVEFGTTVFSEDNTISKTRPSEQEYKQAVAILKSLRKV